MVKASELIYIQKERESKKYIIYDKIYDNIEKKIKLSSDSNIYYTWYKIPDFLLGQPFYNVNDCCNYINIKLNNNGFKIQNYNNNLLLITWFP